VRHVWRPCPMQRAKITNDGIKPQPASHHVRIKNAVCPSQATLSKNHNGLSWRKIATYPKSPKATPKVNIQPTHLLLQKSRHCPAKAAIK
jgi:hypothetical protein